MPSSDGNPPIVLITTLAIYQTEFWVAVADALGPSGITCAFLSFDDRSTELIRARGFQALSPTERPRPIMNQATVTETFLQFGIDDAEPWLRHERMAFGLRDDDELRARLAAYLSFAADACAELRRRGDVVLLQEVGGFVSVIASFIAARRQGIDNWFMEPSFFRGRLFFTRNAFSAPQVPAGSAVVNESVRAYLAATLKSRQIVVPLKDKHHYNSASRKILNLRNALRFWQKLFDKHVLGKHQEFGHNWHHARTHLRMLANSWKLRHHYTPIEALGRFVYYPLHVPADMALTIRAPEYLDQLALIEDVAKCLPTSHRLAIKEHPAMRGAVDADRLVGMLRNNPKIALLSPETNNYIALSKAELVVSVNSKSGAEALLTGTPVLALGDSFYRRSGLVRAVEQREDVPRALAEMLAAEPQRTVGAATEQFFQRIWDASFPGELFVTSRENAGLFAATLLAALELKGPSRQERTVNG